MIRGYLRSANRARSLGQFAPLENRAFCQVHPPDRTQKLHSGQSRGKLDWVFMFAADFNTGSSVHMWCQVTIRTLSCFRSFGTRCGEGPAGGGGTGRVGRSGGVELRLRRPERSIDNDGLEVGFWPIESSGQTFKKIVSVLVA